MQKQDKLVIISMLCVILFVTASYSFNPSALSGYQSITAEWYQVYWENAQSSGKLFTKELSGSTFSWNPDNIYADSGGEIADGMSNLPTITGQVENPKYDRNIDYYDWWINDTVSAANPSGLARHFEWAIDIYTMNVNFYAYMGSTYFVNSKPEIWVELQNNFDSVFSVLGAEDAASYIIYAQTEEYTWYPQDAGWHIIQPSVGNFELMFLDGSTVTPTVPQEGSNLDFAKLTPFSHIAIKFILEQFGKADYGAAPTVNMVVELNVLTVGRFDYVLTYVSGGENQAAPVGVPGLFASIAEALAAGYNALMDGFVGLGEAMFAPLVTAAIIVVCVIVIIFIVRRSRQ